MISNKDIAKQVEQTMQECSAPLNQSIRLVMENCPEQEFKEYRKAIGGIMADIYLKVKQPIHLRFPDLEPEAKAGQVMLFLNQNLAMDI